VLINWLSQNNKSIAYQQYGSFKVYGGEGNPNEGKFTDDFITAATADMRCPKAMVEVTWASSEVDINAVITSNDAINRINRTGQLFNGKTDSGEKWAFIHSGLIADGTFKAMPESDIDQQAGWFGNSNHVSDGSGDFSTSPFLQVTHEARSYSAILIAGDSRYNQFPMDFTVTFTHPGGPTVIAITGNTERVFSQAFTFINDVTVIKLEISKWSAPNTIVKLTQFSGGLIELYRSDEIVELNILEETNSDTGVVPVGNVSANELDLSLLNIDRRFSFGNTDSPFNSSLRSGRKIRVWLGFVLPVGSLDETGDVPGYIVETVGSDIIGYMPYGIYWSKDWISSHTSQVTTTTAYDIAYRLSQKEFLTSDNFTGTVQDIVDEILTEALTDIPDLTWTVNPDTAGILWDNMAFQPKNYLETLKDIAEATLSYTYVDRNGTLVVGSLLQAVTPLESWQEIDLSDYYNFESQPKLDELINRIRVGYTKYNFVLTDIYSDNEEFTIPGGGVLNIAIPWNPSPVEPATVNITLSPLTGLPVITDETITATGAQVEVTGTAGDTFILSATGTLVFDVIYDADETFTVPASGVLDFFILWSTSPVVVTTVGVTLTQVSGAPLLTKSEPHAFGGLLTVTGTPGDTFIIKVTGRPFALEENTETTTEDTSSISIYGVREFALTGNILITTVVEAQNAADLLLTRYGNLRQDASIQWPANTLLSVGDTLEVVEFKSDTLETKDNFLIKRQSITFDGSMQGNVELRRG